MGTFTRNSESALEFEGFPARSDIQISKILTTASGDEIRAIVTSDHSVTLTAVGRPNGNSVIVIGEPGSMPTDSVVYKGFWDIFRGIAAKIAGEVLNGGNGGGTECETTTTSTVKTGPNGNVETVTTTTTKCRPA
jgi:hypothetical protein